MRGKRDVKTFLDVVLKDMKLIHWYETSGRGSVTYFHEIGKEQVKKEFVILRLGCSEIRWKIFRRIPIASIVGEPDSPVRGTDADCLKIQIRRNTKHPQVMKKLENLAKRFREEFGMKVEIISNNIK